MKTFENRKKHGIARFLGISIGVATFLMVAGTILSAPKPPPLQEFNQGRVRGVASRIEYLYGPNPRHILLIGRARLESKDTFLSANRIEFQFDAASQELTGAKAFEKVHIEVKQSPEEQLEADCGQATYDPKAQKIFLTGKVRVVLRDKQLQEPAPLTGGSAVIDLKAQKFTIEGGPDGQAEIWVTPKQSK